MAAVILRRGRLPGCADDRCGNSGRQYRRNEVSTLHSDPPCARARQAPGQRVEGRTLLQPCAALTDNFPQSRDKSSDTRVGFEIGSDRSVRTILKAFASTRTVVGVSAPGSLMTAPPPARDRYMKKGEEVRQPIRLQSICASGLLLVVAVGAD